MTLPFVFKTTRKDRVPNAPDAERLRMGVQTAVATLEALERMGRVKRAEQRAGFQIWERVG